MAEILAHRKIDGRNTPELRLIHRQTGNNSESGITLMVLEQTGKEIVESCQRGDPEAFRALFDLYKDRVYTIALRYTGNPAVAQDVAQETFLKLFAAIAGFRGESGFESWLYRIVANACFDQKRRSGRLRPFIEGCFDALRSPGASALDAVLQREFSAQIQAAVNRLPPDQRMAVILRYSQDLSYEQIAAILGCTTGTVASRLNRAHAALERRLRNKNVLA